jgi:hypothetical protein
METGGKGEVGAKRVTRTLTQSRKVLKASVDEVKVETQDVVGVVWLSDGWHTNMSEVKLTADFPINSGTLISSPSHE